MDRMGCSNAMNAIADIHDIHFPADYRQIMAFMCESMMESDFKHALNESCFARHGELPTCAEVIATARREYGREIEAEAIDKNGRKVIQYVKRKWHTVVIPPEQYDEASMWKLAACPAISSVKVIRDEQTLRHHQADDLDLFLAQKEHQLLNDHGYRPVTPSQVDGLIDRFKAVLSAKASSMT